MRLYCARPGHLFPCLPKQPGYHERLTAAAPLICKTMLYLATMCPSWPEDLRLLDATPVPCGTSRQTVKRPEGGPVLAAQRARGAQPGAQSIHRLLRVFSLAWNPPGRPPPAALARQHRGPRRDWPPGARAPRATGLRHPVLARRARSSQRAHLRAAAEPARDCRDGASLGAVPVRPRSRRAPALPARQRLRALRVPPLVPALVVPVTGPPCR